MGRESIKNTIFKILEQVVPEPDLSYIEDDLDLTDELELDQIDLNQIYAGIFEAFGIDLTMDDQNNPTTIDNIVDLILEKQQLENGQNS